MFPEEILREGPGFNNLINHDAWKAFACLFDRRVTHPHIPTKKTITHSGIFRWNTRDEIYLGTLNGGLARYGYRRRLPS